MSKIEREWRNNALSFIVSSVLVDFVDFATGQWTDKVDRQSDKQADNKLWTMDSGL